MPVKPPREAPIAAIAGELGLDHGWRRGEIPRESAGQGHGILSMGTLLPQWYTSYVSEALLSRPQ